MYEVLEHWKEYQKKKKAQQEGITLSFDENFPSSSTRRVNTVREKGAGGGCRTGHGAGLRGAVHAAHRAQLRSAVGSLRRGLG